MMSSLVPGSLFYTPGLNRKSTPTPRTVTPDQLDRLYDRQELDGYPWPYESPIHNVYDVKNTSTKMIILNNKYGKDHTRLRGYYTGPHMRKSERHTDPERHSRVNSPRNPSHHERCYHSGTPYFEPNIKPGIEWTNQTDRPPNSLSVRSAVNPKRHLHCIIPSATTMYTDTAGDQSSRPVSRISRSSLPPKRYFEEYADLTIGEKIYLWSIEKIYNIENLKRLKQEQYQKLLDLEAKKGQSVTWKDYDKYMRYIQSASTRHYGTRSPSPSHRARSAHSTRSENGRLSSAKNKTPRDDNGTISRPRTTSSRVRRSKTVEPTPDKTMKQESQKKTDDSQLDSEATTSKSEATPSSAASKSGETANKTVSKTDDEKSVNQHSKRPTSKTSQGQGQRPKSSKSYKSLSPYATPLFGPSPYSSRTQSAKSSRSSRPNSNRSVKSKTESVKSSDKENSKDDNSEEKDVIHHKEGVDRPKSRLGHPSPVDKDAQYVLDIKSDSNSDASDFDFSPRKTASEIKDHKQDSDNNSVKLSDEYTELNKKTQKAISNKDEKKEALTEEPVQRDTDTKQNEENKQVFKKEPVQTKTSKDDENHKAVDTVEEKKQNTEQRDSEPDVDLKENENTGKNIEDQVLRPDRNTKESSKDEEGYTDLYTKWKKENELAAKMSATENSGENNISKDDKKGDRIENRKRKPDQDSSDEEDFDRRPNKDLDKIEY